MIGDDVACSQEVREGQYVEVDTGLHSFHRRWDKIMVEKLSMTIRYDG